MIDTIYLEQAVADHPRVRRLLARLPAARVIPCAHYGEIFNRRNQNFRLQKARPALILARKDGRRVLPVPDGYGLDGARGYYFSHMLNCLYDCRYCFLQGMFRAAHYVLFVNFEDFIDDIRAAAGASAQPTWYFSGYDCDSLALEPLTGFAAHCMPALAGIANAWLELRTKSTQVRSLLARAPLARCVCAFSLAPAALIRAYEPRTPSLAARLAAAARLQAHGWPVGLRLDPLLLVDGYEAHYAAFIRTLAERLDLARVHSITLGTLRLPAAYARTIGRLYPEESLLAAASECSAGQVGYSPAQAGALLDFCQAELERHAPSALILRQAASA